MNMSAPRTESSKRKYGEPSANVECSTFVSSTPRCPAIFAASSGCELPATTASRFCGVSETARPTASSGDVGVVSLPSRPGSACSIVTLSTTTLLVDLLRRKACERVVRDVVGDDGSRRRPRIVANSDRSNEHSVYCHADVAPDRRLALGLTVTVGEVRRDRSCADVRPLPDLRVADIREMRHPGVLPDGRLLDLDERAGLRARPEDGSGAKVTEGTDRRFRADLGVDRNHVRAHFRPGGYLRGAAQDREREDHRIGLDLDPGLDPGRS